MVHGAARRSFGNLIGLRKVTATMSSTVKKSSTTKKSVPKPRKDRSDITVGTIEKKHGLPPGTIRNPDGRDTRADKQLGTIRRNARASKRSSKNGAATTEEVTLNAFRKTYNRVNTRKSK